MSWHIHVSLSAFLHWNTRMSLDAFLHRNNHVSLVTSYTETAIGMLMSSAFPWSIWNCDIGYINIIMGNLVVRIWIVTVKMPIIVLIYNISQFHTHHYTPPFSLTLFKSTPWRHIWPLVTTQPVFTQPLATCVTSHQSPPLLPLVTTQPVFNQKLLRCRRRQCEHPFSGIMPHKKHDKDN